MRAPRAGAQNLLPPIWRHQCLSPSGLISTDLTGWSSLTSLLYGDPFTAVSALVWTAALSAVMLAGSILVRRRLEL
jgi:hypothetical protein